MLRANRLFTIVVLVALLVSACQPIVAPAPKPLPTPQGLRFDAPTYAIRGPYAVGVREFTVVGTQENDRPLVVSVWYPALNPEGRPEAVIYEMGFPVNTNPRFTIAGHALQDAPPDLSGGPYPLVVFSHSAWAFRPVSVYLLEHLASRGFVVMATDHEDNWGTLFEPTDKSEVSRPRDMTRQIDFAEQITGAAGELESLIDTEHVAAVGHSMGGEIAMEMGGARLNLLDWQHTFCVTYPDNQDCIDYAPRLEGIAKLAGLDAVPDGLWPDWSDPRVDAIVPLAPNANMFGGGGLDDMRVPVLLMVGSADTSVGPGLAFHHTFEAIPSAVKTRVIFENADHFIFINDCAANPGLAEAGFASLCSDPVWDMDRAHDLINHFVTAFLLAELKGDAEAAKTLTPENVTFPGIRYETIEFGK